MAKILMSTNILPDLPRTLNKKEANITPRILQAILSDSRFTSCPIEIKVTKGNSLYKGQLKSHQRVSLMQSFDPFGKGFKHKLSDIGRIEMPFDAVIFKKSQAWLVIWYEKYKECWAISIEKVKEDKIHIKLAREIGLKIYL